MLWLILFVLIIVTTLIYIEYREHDCLPHKSCNQSVPKPQMEDNPLNTIDKIKLMARNNYDFVNWRLALIAGIIAALPIIYYLKSLNGCPASCNIQIYEWLIIAMLVFAAVYLSNSWIWAHFFYPNGCEIEKSLLQLRDKVQTLIMHHNIDIDTDIFSDSNFDNNFDNNFDKYYSNNSDNFSNSNSNSDSYYSQ